MKMKGKQKKEELRRWDTWIYLGTGGWKERMKQQHAIQFPAFQILI